MWTNEIDFDESVTTVMDDKGQYEDVHLFIDDTGVYIRQYSEELEKYDLISMSSKMFHEMIAALEYPEGVYRTTYKYKEFENISKK